MRSEIARRPRAARPRRDVVALTIPKSAIWIGGAAAVGIGGLLFLLGLWIGRGLAEQPAPVAEQLTLDEEIARTPVPVAPSVPASKTDLQVKERTPKSKHGIQLGAFADRDEAMRFLDRFASALAGVPIHVIPTKVGKGTWYRVRVGSYTSKSDAEAARIALPDELKKGSMAVKY